jgi:hypothetical protein
MENIAVYSENLTKTNTLGGQNAVTEYFISWYYSYHRALKDKLTAAAGEMCNNTIATSVTHMGWTTCKTGRNTLERPGVDGRNILELILDA